MIEQQNINEDNNLKKDLLVINKKSLISEDEDEKVILNEDISEESAPKINTNHNNIEEVK